MRVSEFALIPFFSHRPEITYKVQIEFFIPDAGVQDFG